MYRKRVKNIIANCTDTTEYFLKDHYVSLRFSVDTYGSDIFLMDYKSVHCSWATVSTDLDYSQLIQQLDIFIMACIGYNNFMEEFKDNKTKALMCINSDTAEPLKKAAARDLLNL